MRHSLLLRRLQTQKSGRAFCEGEREGGREISCRVTLADDGEVNKRRRKCLSAPRRHAKAPSWRRRSIRPSIRILEGYNPGEKRENQPFRWRLAPTFPPFLSRCPSSYSLTLSSISFRREIIISLGLRSRRVI